MVNNKSNNRISFLGDISLNGEYIELHKRNNTPFEAVREILNESSLVVGNLECLLESEQGENVLKKPRLKTSKSTFNFLKDINLGLALLAHNHVYDNLEEGLRNTLDFLDENNIPYIGAGFTEEQANKEYSTILNDHKVCILNYVDKDTNPNIPADAGVFVNIFDETKVQQRLSQLRDKYDIIVLCLHWGGRCEGGYYPDWHQRGLAKRLFEYGADLIVGSHSHTLQPYEIINDKSIYYSLGNFCFADISSDGRHIEIANGRQTESCIVSIDLFDKTYKTNIVPIVNDNLHVKVDASVLRRYKKRMIWFKLINGNKIAWKLYYLKLKFLNPVFFYFFGNDRSFIEQCKKVDLGKAQRYIRSALWKRK